MNGHVWLQYLVPLHYVFFFFFCECQMAGLHVQTSFFSRWNSTKDFTVTSWSRTCTAIGIKPVSCQFLQSPPSVQTHSGVPSVTNWSALVPMWMVLMEQAGCRWPCWSRCYSNMHLMTCRPRGHQFIMANKTDLEYIMFPVNVMLRHQRPERTSNKNTEQSFRANECKKRRFTVGHAESNLFGW